MTNHRYINIFALKTPEGMIPFWEIEAYHYNDDTGEETYTYKDENYKVNLIDCVYDLKKRAIKTPVIKDVYPSNLKFSVGETVYREVKPDHMMLDYVESIVYEEYESQYYKAKKMPDWFNKYFTNEELVANDFYELRVWKPWFKMKSGALVKYDMYLNHVYIEK